MPIVNPQSPREGKQYYFSRHGRQDADRPTLVLHHIKNIGRFKPHHASDLEMSLKDVHQSDKEQIPGWKFLTLKYPEAFRTVNQSFIYHHFNRPIKGIQAKQ